MLLVVENAAMAVFYYGLGRLALLLAIPPGYASAIWPPAGLALAGMLAFRYRVWPGIFVGHFLVNLFPSFEASLAVPFIKTVYLAMSIAAGGTLQAALGAFLIRRFVGYPNRLDNEKDIIFFLLLGGPFSCLVGATFGATTLLFLRLVPPADYPFNWFTWWVGDVIGVMLVAPVLVIWAVGRREATLRRQLSVAGLLMVMLVLVVVFFAASRRSEERRLEHEFKGQAEALRNAIEQSLKVYLKLTESVAKEHINLSEIAADIVADFRARDPAREVVVEITERLTASCDRGLIKVALENLFGNAWKFTAKQPNARITFFLEKKDEPVFCVRDNGAGFDMKRAEKLFAPFQRLHQSSEFEGTGIGLATVARIISRHGGRIWVMAAVNQGATFFFTLGGRADLLSDQSNSSVGFKAA
jgi:signal transduction histidine kinase